MTVQTRAQGALGAFGPLKKVASLRDPCPESPKMAVFASQQNKTKQNMADSVVWTGNDSVSIRAMFSVVLFWENQGRWAVPKKKKVEKPQDGRQKSGPNIGNPYQMEDNKAGPSAPPQGGGASRRPLGVLVVFHLVRFYDVFA